MILDQTEHLVHYVLKLLNFVFTSILLKSRQLTVVYLFKHYLEWICLMRGCRLKSSQVFNVCIDLFEYVEMIIVVSIGSIRKGLTIKRDIFFERQTPLYC